MHAGLQQQQSTLHRRVDHGLGELRRGLLRRTVGDELDREHGAEPTYIADGRETLLPGEHAGTQRLADCNSALAKALLVDHVEDRERRGLGHRVADVGTADGAVVRRVHDLRLAQHARERQAGRDRLRNRDQVGLDAVVLDRKQLAGAREARLDLVGDQADPVLVADRAQTLHELLAGRKEPTLALDRLDDDRRHLLGRHLRDEELPQLGERRPRVGAAVVLREGRPIDLGRERSHSDLVRVRSRGECHRHQRAAVEGALERNYGWPLGVEPRELDSVLDRLGAGVEEDGLRGTAERCSLEQPLGELDVGLVGNDREVRMGEARELLGGRLDHARVRVADVEAADAAGEVDEDVAVDVGERRAAPLVRDDRQHDRLGVRNHALLARQDLGGAGAWDGGADVDRLRRGHIVQSSSPAGQDA